MAHRPQPATRGKGSRIDRRVVSSPTKPRKNITTHALQTPVASDPTRIVVLGPQGCGKSSMINAALGKPLQEASMSYGLSTNEFHATELCLNKHNVVLVDSPGFDNTVMPDSEIFKKLVEYLCGKKPFLKLTGVVYIHPEGSSLGGGALKRNMRTLRSLLGSSYLDRLTILLIPRSSGELDLDQLIRPILDPKSPFADLIAAGARCDVAKLETKSIGDILLRYAQRPPELVKLHREYTPGHEDIKRHIEGYLNQKDSTVPPSRTTIKDSSQKQLISKPGTTQHDSSEFKRLEREVADLKLRADDLHTQLQQSRTEYHSLRSQLQLNENVEQSQVLQDLADLNRQIEDFGHSLSEHLIDKYAGPNKTSLHAFRLSELQGLFEHEKGKASLVQSSTGVGMPLEDFFDLAARSILCEQLYKRTFALFHPCVPEPKNGYTLQLYSRIRDEESQPAAGRWRTATFDALTRVVGHDQISQHKEHLARDILNKNIMPLLEYFFGPNKNVELTPRHVESLVELVSHAWEWNMALKGKIILLGDFNPTAYRYGCGFDGQAMAEFEPKHGSPGLTRILSTIGIGLSVSHAQGAGNAPQRIILCKASVVGESRFEA